MCRWSSRGPGPIPLIDRAPVNPLDPIASGEAVAPSDCQGRRPVFRDADNSAGAEGPGNLGRRRSLALDHCEHDGSLMDYRAGCASRVLPVLSMLLIAGGVALAPAPEAMADPSVRVARPTRLVETVPSTDPWAGPIAEAARRFDIPEHWIRAVMAAESDSDPCAVSPKGAMGLMQIMPATWDELRGRYGLGEDAFDPRDNILAGAAYLAELYDLYGSPGFLAAYNAGPGRFERHLVSDEALPAETVAYVAKLLPVIDSKAGPIVEAEAHGRRNTWSSAPLFFEQADGSDRQQGHSQVGSAGLGENAGVARDLSGLSPAASGLFVRRTGMREGSR